MESIKIEYKEVILIKQNCHLKTKKKRRIALFIYLSLAILQKNNFIYNEIPDIYYESIIRTKKFHR